MFLILWPTIRPAIMQRTYYYWLDQASKTYPINIKIAVNTLKHRQILSAFDDVLIVGDTRKGPVWPTYCLTQNLKCEENKIIILASDDFFPPFHWDLWLKNVFSNYDGAIMVEDGYQKLNIITIPIMTYNCLNKLNKIIYHPSYNWQFSDKELYDNLNSLNLIKNMRPSPVFEHRHYESGKREKDQYDEVNIAIQAEDLKNYKTRSNLSLKDKLTTTKGI